MWLPRQSSFPPENPGQQRAGATLPARNSPSLGFRGFHLWSFRWQWGKSSGTWWDIKVFISVFNNHQAQCAWCHHHVLNRVRWGGTAIWSAVYRPNFVDSFIIIITACSDIKSLDILCKNLSRAKHVKIQALCKVSRARWCETFLLLSWSPTVLRG